MNELTAHLASATMTARYAESFEEVRGLSDAALLEGLAAVESLGHVVAAAVADGQIGMDTANAITCSLIQTAERGRPTCSQRRNRRRSFPP